MNTQNQAAKTSTNKTPNYFPGKDLILGGTQEKNNQIKLEGGNKISISQKTIVILFNYMHTYHKCEKFTDVKLEKNITHDSFLKSQKTNFAQK